MIFSTFKNFIVFVLMLHHGATAAEVSNNQIGNIIIKDLWVRPSRLDNSAAYMIIENKGSLLDHLLSAKTDVCGHVELHRIEEVEGVFHMHPVDVIKIPAQSTTVLKPGGMHVMLMKLRKSLNIGEKVKLTLIFEKAGSIELQGQIQLNASDSQ